MCDAPTSETSPQPAELEAIVGQYETPLLRYATRILSDSNAAQDIVQNTFIKLFMNWDPKTIPPSDLPAWLYRVTHNGAVDHIRRECRRSASLARHADEEDSRALGDQRRSGISEAAERATVLLKSLSMREQQIVVLKVYEEKSYRDIAQITGLSEGNVGYILHHAMRKLAAALTSTRDAGGTKAPTGADDDPVGERTDLQREQPRSGWKGN